MAKNVTLRPGESNPTNIRLRADGVAQAISASGGVTFQVPALASTDAEIFASTGAITFAAAALVGAGSVVVPITGTGGVRFAVAGLRGGIPDEASGSPGGHGAGNLVQFPDEDHFSGPPYRQPHEAEDQPLEVPDITPVLPLVAKVDNRPAIIALYESHAIDEDTFAALLAAA